MALGTAAAIEKAWCEQAYFRVLMTIARLRFGLRLGNILQKETKETKKGNPGWRLERPRLLRQQHGVSRHIFGFDDYSEASLRAEVGEYFTEGNEGNKEGQIQGTLNCCGC